jgi:flavin reductase (DIM6/NTAB) family NADH-FMN oxidoreductase RutF
MDKKEAAIQACIHPLPQVLVSCRGLNGENNALAAAYCCNCSYDPPMVMVGIVPSRYSYKMIKDSGCFVVNLPSKANRRMFDYLGSHSGRDEDKLKNIDAKICEGVLVNAPVLDDCPINIECTVVGSILTGSHEMFAGRIVYIHADAELLDNEGNVDFSKIDLL